MAKQDNVKIITTGVLVFLLLAVFIVAFINRNELVQKVQTLGKESEKPERIIETPVPMTDLAQTEPKIENWTDLSTKEPQGLTGVILPKEAATETLAETKLDPSKKGMSSQAVTKEPATVQAIEETNLPLDQKKMISENSPKDTKLPEPKQKNKALHHRSKSQKRNSTLKKKRTKMSTSPKESSSLEKRLKDFEYRYEKQNRSYDRRFREIEDRMDAIEKQLNP